MFASRFRVNSKRVFYGCGQARPIYSWICTALLCLEWEDKRLPCQMLYMPSLRICLLQKCTSLTNGPGHAKTCLMPYANNKGADQPAHPHSLISTFVVSCLDSMIRIQSFKILASFCNWGGLFESYLVKNPRRHVYAWCGSNDLIHPSPVFPLFSSVWNCQP